MEFTLELFTARTSVWNNGVIEAAVTLENCLMDDRRPEKKGKITRCVYYVCVCVWCVLCACMCVCMHAFLL